jgi:phenylalanyl-tRNA synthetase beta chain
MTQQVAFTIKKGKIRGQESHGMICAEDELGLELAMTVS